MNKKISYVFILLLFISTISNSYVGYEHTIKNNSLDPIYILLSYHGYVKSFSCRPDKNKKLMPGEKWTAKSYGCQLKKVYTKNLNTNKIVSLNVHNVSSTGLAVSATVAITSAPLIVAGALAAAPTAVTAATAATVTSTTSTASALFGAGLFSLQLAYPEQIQEFYNDFPFIAYGSTDWTYKISEKGAPYLLPGKGVLGENVKKIREIK